MMDIATGLWWDHSKPAVLAMTLTLPVDQGNQLLSVLALLVTIAGASFWNITAFVLHSWKARKKSVSALDLQHRVSLCNTPGPLGTAWEALKRHQAWSKKHPPRLLARTSAIAVPALLVWVLFSAAAILSSRVANKSYGSVVARVLQHNCGFWRFDTSNPDGMAAYNAKRTNDTIQARTYVSNFYANSSSSLARSIFVRPTLPYTTSAAAACPLASSDRCLLGPNAAFSMTTDLLDSHDMLGINANPTDRVSLQKHVTCAQVRTRGITNVTKVANYTLLEFYLGPLLGGTTNYTYFYNLATEHTDANYLLVPRFAFAQDSTPEKVWEPIPDLKREDADISVFFLSQNAITYLSPVYDKWFLANGTYTTAISGKIGFRPNSYVNVMVCADQQMMCNPSTSSCTSLGGRLQIQDSILEKNSLGFNPAQMVTAGRLLIALADTSTYESVANLGAAALWANNLISVNLSPGLPDNQWQTEVLGWFQTSLAKLQAYVVDYASNAGGLSRFGAVESPNSNRTNLSNNQIMRDHCANQLVQTTGDVQNFSFLGVMVIVCFSAFLVLLDWSLESIINVASRLMKSAAVVKEARQADGKLNLLLAALGGQVAGGSSWERGAWAIPILDPDARFGRSDHHSSIEVDVEDGNGQKCPN